MLDAPVPLLAERIAARGRECEQPDEGGVDEARLSPRPDQRPCTLVRTADTLPAAANANAGVHGAARGGAPRVV